MLRILVFGASITYGAWDKEGGWVQRLRKFFDKNKPADTTANHQVYNLAISGATTDDLLKRFEFEAKQKIIDKYETIIIFSLGMNDSQFVHSKNDLRAPTPEFQNNIQYLINQAKKFTPKIIFVGLTPVDESKTTPIAWNTDLSYKNEYTQKYNEHIKSVCRKNKVNFIDIYNEFAKMDHKNLLEDGLHPNSEGHNKIFEIVKDFLIQNKII